MTGLSVTVNEGAIVFANELRPSPILLTVLVTDSDVDALKDSCEVILLTFMKDGVSTYFMRTKFRRISSLLVSCKTSL